MDTTHFKFMYLDSIEPRMEHGPIFSHSNAYFNAVFISGFIIQVFQGKSQNNIIKGSCKKINCIKSI